MSIICRKPVGVLVLISVAVVSAYLSWRTYFVPLFSTLGYLQSELNRGGDGTPTFNCDGNFKRDVTKPTLALGILSKTEHKQLRNVHRRSLRVHKDLPFNVIVCFLLDRQTHSTELESRFNRDIVFLNTAELGWGRGFGEKLYKWFVIASERFPSADLIGKMDDDVFMCSPEMFDRLKGLPHPRLYYGWQHTAAHRTALLRRIGEDRFEHIHRRIDELFVVVGKELVDRILQRKFCSNKPECDPLVDLRDEDFADVSLALWLSVYPDVIKVPDNERIFEKRPKMATYFRPDFCDNFVLMHKVKSPQRMAWMYNYRLACLSDC